MKRDWELIRDVLIEVEALNPAQFEDIRYGPLRQSDNVAKDSQAVLLWKARFIEGVDASSMDLGDSVIAQELTAVEEIGCAGRGAWPVGAVGKSDKACLA